MAAACTCKLAAAEFPAPPVVDVTCTEFVRLPGVLAVTFTTIVHVPFCGTAPPVRLMLAVPAAAATVPPHVPVTPGILATVNPAGSASLKDTPASATVLTAGLVMVKVNVVVPFTERLAAPNVCAIAGGAATVRFAVAVFTIPPALTLPPELLDLIVTLLVTVPVATPSTPTEIVQEAFGARFAFASVRLVAVAPAVPPQLFVTLAGV